MKKIENLWVFCVASTNSSVAFTEKNVHVKLKTPRKTNREKNKIQWALSIRQQNFGVSFWKLPWANGTDLSSVEQNTDLSTS